MPMQLDSVILMTVVARWLLLFALPLMAAARRCDDDHQQHEHDCILTGAERALRAGTDGPVCKLSDRFPLSSGMGGLRCVVVSCAWRPRLLPLAPPQPSMREQWHPFFPWLRLEKRL